MSSFNGFSLSVEESGNIAKPSFIYMYLLLSDLYLMVLVSYLLPLKLFVFLWSPQTRCLCRDESETRTTKPDVENCGESGEQAWPQAAVFCSVSPPLPPACTAPKEQLVLIRPGSQSKYCPLLIPAINLSPFTLSA